METHRGVIVCLCWLVLLYLVSSKSLHNKRIKQENIKVAKRSYYGLGRLYSPLKKSLHQKSPSRSFYNAFRITRPLAPASAPYTMQYAGSPSPYPSFYPAPAPVMIPGVVMPAAAPAQDQNSNWGSWSSCGQPCSGYQGVQSRNRECTIAVPTMTINPPCTSTYETRACHITICLSLPSGTTPSPPTTSITSPPLTTTQKPTTQVLTSTLPPPPTTRPGTTPPVVCKAKVDLGFLIDGSTSIDIGNFQKIKDFVVSIVKEFEISQQNTHVGAVLFSTAAKVVFSFDESYERQSIIQKIDNIEWPTGDTHIGAALKLAKYGLYSKSLRNAMNIPKILIILTDGQAQDQVTNPAQELRDLGVTIFAVGIGNSLEQRQLNDMATDPDSEHVFTTPNFNTLTTIKTAIKDKACKESGGVLV